MRDGAADVVATGLGGAVEASAELLGRVSLDPAVPAAEDGAVRVLAVLAVLVALDSAVADSTVVGSVVIGSAEPATAGPAHPESNPVSPITMVTDSGMTALRIAVNSAPPRFKPPRSHRSLHPRP
jgi:hypothetical protein